MQGVPGIAPSATPQGPHVPAPGGSVHDFQQIKEMADQGRQDLLTRGLSRGLSHALKRGETLAERKSAWPFDYYRITGFFPVDYRLYSRSIQTDCGPSELITLHASAYTAEGEEFAADQVYHKEVMHAAHMQALRLYLTSDMGMGKDIGFKTKTDKWGLLQSKLIKQAKR